MVIYDLECELGHQFEGWFKNNDDLLAQQKSGLLTCPFCDSDKIIKKPTAAKVTRKSNREVNAKKPDRSILDSQSTTEAQPDLVIGNTDNKTEAAKFAELQSMLGKIHDYIDDNFQDVGNRFAEEAISIHRGEKEAANIKGTVSAEEAKELAEEGVQAVALPPRPIDKKKIN